MIDITELQRGDIIIVLHNGQPYHAAIYAPTPERVGDIIHAAPIFEPLFTSSNFNISY